MPTCTFCRTSAHLFQGGGTSIYVGLSHLFGSKYEFQYFLKVYDLLALVCGVLL